MKILKMRKATLLRKLEEEEPSWIEEWMADPDKALKEIKEEAPAGFENLPLVSVQPKEVIFVEFLTDPVEKIGKDGREKAFANVEMLKGHRGWNSQAKAEITLKTSEKAAINLKRHVVLWSNAQANMPLKGRRFAIGNLGKVKTKLGSACDYRWKEIPKD